MEITCDIIKDVLPLYAEDLASADTKAMVEAHLPTCADCKDTLHQLRGTTKLPLDVEFGSLDSVKKSIRKRRVLTGLLVFFLTVSALLVGFFHLTRPIYLTAEEAEIQILENEDGVFFQFGENVDCFVVYQEKIEGTETYCYTITAYDRWLNIRYGNMVDARRFGQEWVSLWSAEHTGRICYDQGPLGEEDLLLWGEPGREHSITLPRLVLGYYFLMALGAGVILLVPAVFLRRKRAGKVFGAMAGLFFSYAAASLMEVGLDWHVYENAEVPVYFVIIVILALCLWSGGLIGWKLWARKS